MRTVSLLILATSSAWARSPVELTLRNPSDAPRADIVTLRLYELDIDLPPAGGLQVLDAEGKPLTSQLDDLDLSGGLSPQDALAFLVHTGPYETTTVTVKPGDARMSQAQWVAAGGLEVKAGGYEAAIAEDGGWLRDLRLQSDPGILVSSLSQSLRSGGFEPEVVFSQQGLKAEIVHCVGPLREVVLARYDLDEKPFGAPSVVSYAGELRSGCRGEVLYALYHDYLSVTHRIIPDESGFPVQACQVEALLGLPGTAAGVLSRWATGSGQGDLPGVLEGQAQAPPATPELREESFVDLLGPIGGVALVYEAETTGAVELGDCRLDRPDPRDLLRYTRYVDSTESTMWLVPHLARDDVSALVRRLSDPIAVEYPASTALAELTEARGILDDLAAKLTQARRGENFVTPAEVQLQACEHLLAMAEVCARNRRETQACRLALEVAERASGARSFLADSQERHLRPPELGRDGEILTGVCFTARGRDFPRGYRRSLERLSRYGIGCVHDTDTFSWAACEPRPGEFDLTRADQYMDMLQQLGLRYLPCVDPWLSPPQWLSAAEAPGLAQRYLEQVLLHYRSRETPLAWVVRNAPVAWGAEPGAAGLYGFRDWLTTRYRTPEALSEAWGRQYARFADVEPPAATPAPSVPVDKPLAEAATAPPGSAMAAHDLALYGAEALATGLDGLAQLARRLDPGRPVAVKSLDAMPGLNPAMVGDPWLLRAVQDPVYCHSFFFGPEPEATSRSIGDWRLSWAFATAVQRSAVGSRPIWCGEWNQLWWGPGFAPAGRADVRLMTWAAVAEGLRGVFAYSHPSGKWPVGSFDDTPLPVLEEYGVLSAEFSALGPSICQSEPAKPRIAIYWPRDSILYGFAGELHADPGDPRGPTAALRSLWQMLSVEAHYPVDFVSDREIVAGGLGAYDGLVLTGAPFLDGGVARHMADFARAGGVLVVLGPCGVFDSAARLSDPAPVEPLREVMGARITAVRTGEITVGPQTIATGGPVACYAPLARYLTAAGQLATTGELAAYSRNVGRGHVVACGAELGVETDIAGGAGRRWLVEQLESYGITAPVEQLQEGSEIPKVHARLFSLGDRSHLLVANLSGAAGWCRLRVNEGPPISEGPVDLLTGTRVYQSARRAIDVQLGPHDVRWVCL